MGSWSCGCSSGCVSCVRLMWDKYWNANQPRNLSNILVVYSERRVVGCCQHILPQWQSLWTIVASSGSIMCPTVQSAQQQISSMSLRGILAQHFKMTASHTFGVPCAMLKHVGLGLVGSCQLTQWSSRGDIILPPSMSFKTSSDFFVMSSAIFSFLFDWTIDWRVANFCARRTYNHPSN